MSPVDPVTLTMLSRALDAAQLRHAAHAQNLANASRPGAQRVQVSFEEQLGAVRAALDSGRPISARDLPQASLAPAGDGGPIQLDVELAALSRNAMHYQALARVLGRHLGLMSLAVADGRR